MKLKQITMTMTQLEKLISAEDNKMQKEILQIELDLWKKNVKFIEETILKMTNLILSLNVDSSANEEDHALIQSEELCHALLKSTYNYAYFWNHIEETNIFKEIIKKVAYIYDNELEKNEKEMIKTISDVSELIKKLNELRS